MKFTRKDIVHNMDTIEKQREELKTAIESIKNLYEELEKEKKRFEELVDEMREHDAPETILQSANEIYDLVNSRSQKAPETSSIPREEDKKKDVIPFEQAPMLGEEKKPIQNQTEKLSEEEAKEKLVTMKLSNSLAQRTISLVKAGAVGVWNKLASHFDRVKSIQYKNEIEARKLQILKVAHQKEEYEQKMRPVLEKRFAKHNKWREKHHMDPLPPEEMYKVYKQSELVHLDTLDAVIESNARICNIFNQELAKLEEKSQERKQFIHTHKNIAANKYVIDKKQTVLIQNCENAKEKSAYEVPERASKNEPMIQISTEQAEVMKNHELNDKLDILLVSPSNSAQYKSIVSEYKEKNEKTGKLYPAKGIENSLVAMAYVTAQKVDYPNLYSLDYREAIKEHFPSSSDQEKEDIETAIYNPEVFISEANLQQKDLNYKNKILLAAIQVEPKSSTLAIAFGIKENMMHGEKPYQALGAFVKESIRQTKGAVLESLPPQMVKAIDNQINVERTLNAMKREEKQEKSAEKTPKQTLEKNTTQKQEKSPEIVPPLEPEAPEVTEADAEKLMRMFNEGKTVSKEENWNVMQEAKEEADRRLREGKANRDFNIIDENLKDGACLDFTVGGIELRAERNRENGELIIGQYDYEEKKYLPMEKQDIINAFMDHPKDVTNTIIKNLSDSPKKENTNTKENEPNLA